MRITFSISLLLSLLSPPTFSFGFSPHPPSTGAFSVVVNALLSNPPPDFFGTVDGSFLCWNDEKTEYKKRLVTQLLDADSVEDTNVRESGGGDER